jgi:hypothetical protein
MMPLEPLSNAWYEENVFVPLLDDVMMRLRIPSPFRNRLEELRMLPSSDYDVDDLLIMLKLSLELRY